MKKTVLLIILCVITVFCIIIGTIRNVGRGFNLFNNSVISLGEDEPEVNFKWHWHSDNDGNKESNFSINQSLDKFSAIRIDGSVMEIRVEEGDKFYFDSTFTRDWLRPNVSVENDTLVIKQGRQKNGFKGGNNNCRIVITLPSGTKLSDIVIDSNVGDIKLRNLFAERIDIQTNVGEVSVRDVSFDKLEVNSNVGEISIAPVYSIDEYSISASTDVGEVRVDGKKYKRNYNSSGSTGKRIKLSANVGEVNIK
ncbi:DUF4097 family beta strand repeat-containing protein [Treponema bryantii]|uniref:DUF4097 family beta strand repeat-containing protein n=1 Tax=Treponema bryantii TaxID=163 RepID=UPI0003B4897B|nr:DUF4097 family beta strand repeat-containing protein [Treponema bryantii]